MAPPWHRKVVMPVGAGSKAGQPSGRAAVVVVEETAETLMSGNYALGVAEHGIDEIVADALVIALLEIVSLEFPAGPEQRIGAEEDHPVEALVLDGLDESFGVGVAVGSGGRDRNRADARVPQ